MLLRIASSPAAVAAASQLSAPGPAHGSARLPPLAKGPSTACRAAGKGKKEEVLLSGVMFQPFEELKGELSLVPQAEGQSLARQKFVDECEAAINEQINVEYNASYAYHSLYAYFDRDNVALKGFAKFFKESSDEEREHAEMLMEYQNRRGGRVRLQSIVTPLTEFDHSEKGDALYAMELALALEKLVNEKLHNLHSVATRCNDPQLSDFVESQFLQEQVKIKPPQYRESEICHTRTVVLRCFASFCA
uniref:Ferritin n=1 Tax=Aegilops tauschii subsp. strangulata TaxID=200361 RepID=A0A453HS42_AEGTS